jgi:hypothetical protein
MFTFLEEGIRSQLANNKEYSPASGNNSHSQTKFLVFYGICNSIGMLKKLATGPYSKPY